jgi:hypothetical protein
MLFYWCVCDEMKFINPNARFMGVLFFWKQCTPVSSRWNPSLSFFINSLSYHKKSYMTAHLLKMKLLLKVALVNTMSYFPVTTNHKDAVRNVENCVHACLIYSLTLLTQRFWKHSCVTCLDGQKNAGRTKQGVVVKRLKGHQTKQRTIMTVKQLLVA